MKRMLSVKVTLVTMVCSLFLLCVFIGSSYALEITSFGPNKYLKTKWIPKNYTDAFPGITGQGKLIIKNGDENGEHRVSCALVKINGKKILGPKDFFRRNYKIEVPVNLAKKNSISVELWSRPGSFLTVEVTQDVEGEAATNLTTMIFSEALKREDVTKALDFVEESSKSKFQAMFTDLGIAGMKEIGETIQNAAPVFVGNNYAEYEAVVAFPNGENLIGMFSLVKTSKGWKFNQL